MSKEIKPDGDKGSKSTKSFVERTSLINEIIKRENRFYSINKVFTLNPRKLIVTTEKPTSFKYNPSDYVFRSQEIPKSNSLFNKDIFEKIQHHFKGPKEKYDLPVTSNHEIGWYFSDLLNKDTFQRKKFPCDVTKYANDYASMTGRSPFSKKTNIIKKEEEKKS